MTQKDKIERDHFGKFQQFFSKMKSCFLKLDRARGIFSLLGIQCVSERSVLQEEPEPGIQHANDFYLTNGIVCLLLYEFHL